MPAVFEHATRRPRDCERDEVCDNIGRCLYKICLDFGETKSLHDGWEEVFERLRNDEREVHARELPGEWVAECHPEAFPMCAFVVFGYAACRDELAVLRHFRFFGGEVVCTGVVREVWQKLEARYCDEDADDAFEEEKPLP